MIQAVNFSNNNYSTKANTNQQEINSEYGKPLKNNDSNFTTESTEAHRGNLSYYILSA